MSRTVFYVAGVDANFHELRDALYCAAEEAVRTHEEQSVMVATSNQPDYTYCRVRMGDQA